MSIVRGEPFLCREVGGGALLLAVEGSTHDSFSDLPLLFTARFSWLLSKVCWHLIPLALERICALNASFTLSDCRWTSPTSPA